MLSIFSIPHSIRSCSNTVPSFFLYIYNYFFISAIHVECLCHNQEESIPRSPNRENVFSICGLLLLKTINIISIGSVGLDESVVYQGIKGVKMEEVEDPKLEKPYDILVRNISTSICGSDLHLIHRMVLNMHVRDVLDHEPMGIVEEWDRRSRG